MKHWWIPFLSGMAITAAAGGGSGHILVSAAYPAAQGLYVAQVLVCLLACFWLPLLASGWLGKPGGAFPALGLATAGSGLVCLGAVLLAGLSPGPVLWGHAIALAVSAAILSVGQAPCVFRITLAGRRARVFGLALFFLTTPFWFRGLLRLVWESDVANTITVWCSPGLCLTSAFPDFDMIVEFPTLYRIWGGPVVAYPTHPVWPLLVYGGLAVFLTLLTRIFQSD